MVRRHCPDENAANWQFVPQAGRGLTGDRTLLKASALPDSLVGDRRHPHAANDHRYVGALEFKAVCRAVEIDHLRRGAFQILVGPRDLEASSAALPAYAGRISGAGPTFLIRP